MITAAELTGAVKVKVRPGRIPYKEKLTHAKERAEIELAKWNAKRVNWEQQKIMAEARLVQVKGQYERTLRKEREAFDRIAAVMMRYEDIKKQLEALE